MTTTTQAEAKSRIFGAVHETASDLHRLGFINKRNMSQFDALCLEPAPDYDSFSKEIICNVAKPSLPQF